MKQYSAAADPVEFVCLFFVAVLAFPLSLANELLSQTNLQMLTEKEKICPYKKDPRC